MVSDRPVLRSRVRVPGMVAYRSHLTNKLNPSVREKVRFTMAVEFSAKTLDLASLKDRMSTTTNDLTDQIIKAIQSLDPGKAIEVTFTDLSEARGMGRRVSKAIEVLKLPKDAILTDEFNKEAAEKALAKDKKIVRIIGRVK